MKNLFKLTLIIAFGVIMSLLPVPSGLNRDSWVFLSIFLSVIVGLIMEPFPSGFIGILGVIIACILKIGPPLGSSEDLTSEQVLKWGLSGFSNATIWLIFVAFMLAKGFEKSGLGRRIALLLVRNLGSNTLGLGYAIALTDLMLAPFVPSNTARSGGTIFPIVKNIPLLYGSTPAENPRKIGSYITWVALASTCVTSSMFYTAMSPNILAVSILADNGIIPPTWEQWVFYFLPVGLILIIFVPLVTYFIYPPTLKISKSIPQWAGSEIKNMGAVKKNEVIMILLLCLALLLWVFGDSIDLNPTLSALIILCLMILLRIITWNDILTNKEAWNVFLWFGTLVTLAGGLSNVGFIGWYAEKITPVISSFSPNVIIVFLLLAFYFIHYLFASTTAHVATLLAIFLMTAKEISEINLPLLTYLLLFSIGLMGILTPYATGPSPIWFGLGYIQTKTFWLLGAFFGLLFILVLLLVGIPWINIWI